jgi:hypothetical protein
MSAEIERRLGALRDQVAGAVDALDTAHGVRLAQIQSDVDGLCRDLAALPRAEGARHLQELRALSAELDGLEGMMRSRLNALSEELQSHGTREQAVRAYGRSSDRRSGGAGSGAAGGGR